MPGLTSRRRPWPYHSIVNGIGLILKPNPQTGLIYGKKAITGENVIASSYDYGAYSPFVERPFPAGPFTGGMGEQVQSAATGVRYKYAENADMSIGGKRRIGPAFTSEMISSGQQVNYLAVGISGGASALFALVGKYVYVNTTGTWTLSRTSPYNHLQGVQYQGTAGSNRFWATNDAGELWGYDGTNWAQAALPVGAKAAWVEKVGTSLVIGSGSSLTTPNAIRICNVGDPMLAASWGGAIYVGDYGKAITWLRALTNQLFIFKEDGIFTTNTDGSTNDLFPELRNTVGPWRGRNASVFRSALWFAYGNAFYQMTGGATAILTPVGPERMVDLDQTMQGSPICFVGHANWFGYLGVSNSGTGTRLFKYGTWINDGSPSAAYKFADEWNGSLSFWSGKVITSAYVTDAVSNQPRLYLGFADGSVEWTVLPSMNPDPAKDSNCRFNVTVPSYVYWSDHTALAQSDLKHFRAFSVSGSRIDSSNYVGVEYRTDPTQTWTPLSTPLTSNGQRVTTGSTVVGNILQVRERLYGTSTTTPDIATVTLLEQIQPSLILEYDLTAEARRCLPRRDGLVDRRTGEQIRNALKAIAGPVGAVVLELPDEINRNIDTIDYAEMQIPDAFGLAWDISLKLMEFQSNTVFGIVDRATLTVDSYAGYTVNQMASL